MPPESNIRSVSTQVMPGYFKNATATAETLVDDWCHTGDIGYYDEQGRVFIVDRKKELIKVPETSGNTAKTLATKHANLVNNTTYVLKTKSNVEKVQQE